MTNSGIHLMLDPLCDYAYPIVAFTDIDVAHYGITNTGMCLILEAVRQQGFRLLRDDARCCFLVEPETRMVRRSTYDNRQS